MSNRILSVFAATLLLAACSSTDTGGDKPPRAPEEPRVRVTAMHGIVRYLDTGHRLMEIESGTSTLSVEYKKNAQVRKGAGVVTPAEIERGDEIDFKMLEDGFGHPKAEDIVVTRNAADAAAATSLSGMAIVRGSVLTVDDKRRIITLDQTTFRNGTTGGTNRPGLMVVRYNADAVIEDNGRSSPVESLERGNVVEIQVEHNNLSDFRATRIVLIRDSQ